MDVVKEPMEMFEGEAKDKTEGKMCLSITKLGVDSLQGFGMHWEITQWKYSKTFKVEVEEGGRAFWKIMSINLIYVV